MVVYYARRTSDGMIKIGQTTSAVWFRMHELAREHGELQVLMTDAGYRAEEKVAHDRFAVYRVSRSEWFYPALPLLRWICETRQIPKYAEIQMPECVPLGEIKELIAVSSGVTEAEPGQLRVLGICQNCGQHIERPDGEIWLHAQSRKVSCQLFAAPAA